MLLATASNCAFKLLTFGKFALFFGDGIIDTFAVDILGDCWMLHVLFIILRFTFLIVVSFGLITNPCFCAVVAVIEVGVAIIWGVCMIFDSSINIGALCGVTVTIFERLVCVT